MPKKYLNGCILGNGWMIESSFYEQLIKRAGTHMKKKFYKVIVLVMLYALLATACNSPYDKITEEAQPLHQSRSVRGCL